MVYESKYLVVKSYILSEIESGRLTEGKRLPSENELAKQFDVSTITTRRALNELVNERIIYRVKGKGSFVATRQEAENKDENNNIITVLMPTTSKADDSIVAILKGVNDYLSEFDYNLQLEFSGIDINEEGKILDQFISGNSCGLIAYSLNPDALYPRYKQMLDLGRPFVLIDRGLKNSVCNLVACDNYSGTYQSTSKLIECGHSKIIYVSMDDYLPSEKRRLEGYMDAMKNNGVIVRDDMILNSKRDSNRICEYVKQNGITAVVCVNDITASSVMRKLTVGGLNVPDDISIFGFDNSIICKHTSAKLSSVDQPFDVLGYTAAKLLGAVIKSDAMIKSQIFIPVKLVLRDSHKVI